MENADMKAVIYARQSSGDDDFSESVEIQKRNCLNLAKQKKLEIVGEFQDLNLSGKLYPTGFEELASKDICYQQWLKSVRSRKTARSGLGEVFKLLSDIDYIIVDDYTRLARPLTGSFLDAILTQSLSANNIKVLTVKGGEIDLTAFNDSLITALQNRINDNQLSIQRQKSKDGLKKLKDSGVNLQGLPTTIGFRSTGRKHEIELVEREVEAVKYVYKSFLKGVNINKILRGLNEDYSDCFKRQATRQMVMRILERPTYCGYMYDSQGSLIKSLQVGDKAFISFEDWQKVKKILDIRKVTKPRPKHVWNPFCGYIFCGKCGAKMKVRGSKFEHQYFSCVSHFSLKKDPCKGNLTLSRSVKYGLGLIEAVSPLLVIGALEKLKHISLKSELKDDFDEIQVKLNNILEKEKRFTELFIKGLIEDATYESYLAELAKTKHNLKAQLIGLQESINSSEDEESTRKLLRKIVAGKITKGEYEDLVRTTIKRIEISPEKVMIKTVAGDVCLPRQKMKIYNLLPYFTFANKGDDTYALYYYYGEKRLMANIYGKKEKVVDLGGFNIYYMRN